MLQFKSLVRRAGPLAVAGALAMQVASAGAQTSLEIALPWGVNEFHTLNAGKFAERVAAETDGQVLMKVRAGGELGVKATGTVRAVAEGVVPMADSAMFLNASRGQALAVETLPFLVKNYEQLKVMHSHFRPLWEDIMTRNGQKVLYIVPWPNQFFFLKKPISSLADLEGMKMRTLDRLTTDWINRLGMKPVQMTNLEILQALGSGVIDGVPTSAGTAVAQKYWDFVSHGYETNHIWASNAMTINLDTWNALTESQRATIEKIAAELEPEFWAVSEADHAKKVAELKANGMKVAPMPDAVVKEMQSITKELWKPYTSRMGDDALKALADYRAEVGS